MRCRMPGPFRYGWLALMLVFTVVGAPLLIIWSNRGGPGAPPASFAFLWIAGMAWVWFCSAALFPYEIRLSEDGEIEFKSVLRSVKVNARDLISIAPGFRGWDPNILLFKTRTRTVRTLRQMDGLHDLVTELRASIRPDFGLSTVLHEI